MIIIYYTTRSAFKISVVHDSKIQQVVVIIAFSKFTIYKSKLRIII